MYSNSLVCNIIKYINDNYKNDITIDNISNLFSYDKSYIMKLFKRETGDTIINYLNKLKVYKSIQYLHSNNSILNISLLSGFNSLEYYSEIFKKYIGTSPSNYRNLFNLENKLDIITNINRLKIYLDNIDNYLKRSKPDKLPIYKRSIFN